MAETLKSVFDKHCAHIVIDVKYAQRIIDFAKAFVNKNPDHVRFFGGALIGVYPIRWLNSDLDRWWDVIMEGADDVEIRKGICAVPGIDPSWVRGADETNHSMLYIVHLLHHSKLAPRLKAEAQLATLEILQYKFLSSLMFHYYPHPAPLSVAQATYNALSKKFDLKVAGSWLALLRDRALDMLTPTGVHRKTIANFTDTKGAVYMITDAQGRLRSIVKNITSVFYQVKDAGAGVLTESAMGEGEDGAYLKDKTTAIRDGMNYLTSIVSDRRGFVRKELLRLITRKMSTSRDWLVEGSLGLLSERYGDPKYPEVKELCTETLLHAFEVMSTKQIRTNDYPMIIDTLKKSYMASRETHPGVLKMRKLGDDLVLAALPAGRSTVVAPDRGAVLLYIVLRTLTQDNFK